MATTKHNAHGLTLVQSHRKAPSAPILRASVIEGTGGKDADTHQIPSLVQEAIDKKARALADGAYELIRESIMRGVGCQCFIGKHGEICLEDKAIEFVKKTTLDSALAPIVRQELENALFSAKVLMTMAVDSKEKIESEYQRLSAL